MSTNVGVLVDSRQRLAAAITMMFGIQVQWCLGWFWAPQVSWGSHVHGLTMCECMGEHGMGNEFGQAVGTYGARCAPCMAKEWLKTVDSQLDMRGGSVLSKVV